MSDAYGYDTVGQELLAAGIDVLAGSLTTSLASQEAEVFYPRKARVQVALTRSAANVSPVTLYFAAIGLPGQAYPNIPSFSMTVDLSDPMLAALGAPTDIVADAYFNADTYYAIKLLGVRNDGATDITGLTATVNYKR